MEAVLRATAPGLPLVELMRDAPAFDPRAAAYLLAAYAEAFPREAVFLCVVDPGVGSERAALVVEAKGRRFVGPDNGLLAIAGRRDPAARAWHIAWRPERLSASFHGRDLFAPVAAMLAAGKPPALDACALDGLVGADWPSDLAEVVYLDPYGNAVTGLRAAGLSADTVLGAAGRGFRRAVTFSDVAIGEAFWYENANGLAEIAVNQGSAGRQFGIEIGSPITILRVDE
jgi:S-adenosylmethionine hydrolase